MRKIYKTCHLATAYRNWEVGLEAANDPHPKYNSSAGEYYLDIVMNLFHCQNGLCAYTEIALCPPHYYRAENWDNATGRYISPNAPHRPQTRGQLEHFDRTRKATKAWLWENFFMADTDVNTKIKSIASIDPILKPDSEDYNEYLLLEYDYSKHIFIPNIHLSKSKQRRIKKMIETLGINFDPVIEARRMYLEPRLHLIDFGKKTWANTRIEQFPTAFEMIRRELNQAV